jgi:hypothetical protein
LYEFEGCSGDCALNRLAGAACAHGLASRRRCLAGRSVEQPSRVLVVDRGAGLGVEVVLVETIGEVLRGLRGCERPV